MYHKFTEQNYPGLNVVVKEYSEGYHKNTVYRVKLFLPCYFCPPLLCPFTLAKNFDLSLYCPDKADTNTVIQKLFWIRLVLSSPTENEGERSIYNMGMNIFLYTAILFIK